MPVSSAHGETATPVETVRAHPLVEADAGNTAIMRGPIVYCLESADNAQAVRKMGMPSRTVLNAHHRPDLLPYYANTNRGPVDMVVWLPEV